jgi:Zn-dependent protease with chaperone function
MSLPTVTAARSCPHCGRVFTRADARFCGKCGTKLPNFSNGSVPIGGRTDSRVDALALPVQEHLPILQPHQKLDIAAIRHPSENTFLMAIIAINVAVLIGIPLLLLLVGLGIAVIYALAIITALFALDRLTFALFYWFMYGNSILIGPNQYPALYRAICTTCEYIDLTPMPQCFVLHGQGLLELFLIKRFTKRGILVFTSEIVDKLLDDGDSRQLMMLIGRQLGHIKAGHYSWYFCKHVIGRFAVLFYSAWRRRCHYTADRIGFLATANLDAARHALLTITVGKVLSDITSIDCVREQDGEVRTRFVARVRNLFSEYPYMVQRIIELESFRNYVFERPFNSNVQKTVATLPPEAARFTIQSVVVQGPAVFGDGASVLQ